MTTTIQANVLTITGAADAAVLAMREKVADVQAQAVRVREARIQAEKDVNAAVCSLQDELSAFASFLADHADLLARTNAHQYAGAADPTIEPAAAPREAVEEGVIAAKPARKRGKAGKTADTFPPDFVAALVATGTVNALVVPSSSGSRVVADDGTVYDRAGGPDHLADLLSAGGLTVYRTYDAWDARQPS
jgi:hypothetical protein